MSIAQNLKLMNKPIAELAMLPQETIMTMAQSGQIPVAFVAPILNTKAEMDQAAADAAAVMAQQQQDQTAVGSGTVIEKIIAQNAMNEAQQSMPMMPAMPPMGQQMPMELPEDSGIAALPVSEDMVPEYAGGGIVAFSNGGATSPFGRDFQKYMDVTEQRREENRLRNLLRQQYGRAAGPFGYFMDQSPEDRARAQDITSRLNTMSAAEMQQLLGMPTTSTALSQDAANTEAIIAQAERGEGPNVSRPGGITPVPRGLAPAAPSEVALVTPEGQTLIPRQGMSIEDFKAKQKAFGITDDVDADLKKQIEELAAGSKGDRAQAKYMAMLQAGLGIMGGSSPYALQNIGTGAQKGVAQYASDIKDIKKEERDLVKLRGELARAEDARKRGDFKSFEEANDRARKLEIDLMQAESGRMLAEASQTRAKAAGSGITLSQMANLRMKAEKEVDPASVRNAIAKEKKLSKIPKPGENKKFDAAVEAAYEAEIERRVNRALGGSTRSGSGTAKDLSGYRIVPEDDE